MSSPEPAFLIEEVVVGVRRHGRRLVLPVVVLFSVAAAAGFWVGRFPEAWMNWAAGAGALLLALLFGIGPVLSWLATRTTVTTRRVILRRGVLVRYRTEVPISRVREVRLRRGVLQRVFGSGDIELLVGAEAPTRVRDVPAPHLLVDALHELIERNYTREDPEAHGGPVNPGRVPLPPPGRSEPDPGFTAVLPG